MRQQGERPPIPRSDPLMGHVVSAHAHAAFHTSHVDLWIRRGDKIKGDFISRVVRTDHDLHLAWVRHDRLEAETLSPPQTGIALEVGDGLGLRRSLRLREVKGPCYVIRIDMDSKINTGVQEIPDKRTF